MPPSKTGVKRRVDGLGERIVAIRRAKGISQQVLATRAGISIPRLGDAARYGAATTETLKRVASALGTTVDVLVARKNSPTKDVAPEIIRARTTQSLGHIPLMALCGTTKRGT